MSVLSVAPISYENSITKKELPLNIFQGKFPIAIKREVSIRIYRIEALGAASYRTDEGGAVIIKVDSMNMQIKSYCVSR